MSQAIVPAGGGQALLLMRTPRSPPISIIDAWPSSHCQPKSRALFFSSSQPQLGRLGSCRQDNWPFSSRIRGTSPFLLYFTFHVLRFPVCVSQELAVNPAVCVIGHEPLDDYCAAGKSSGNGKRQVGWLRVALNPPDLEVYSEHMGRRMARGEAWRAAWRQWKTKLIQHSLPCRVEEVRSHVCKR